MKDHLTNGIIFDIQKFSLYDGPGIRTTVFLKGCALRCEWCCNPESQSYRPQLAFEETHCTNCMDCIASCQHNVLKANGNHLQVNFENCVGCGACVKECVTDALKIYGYEIDAESIIREVIKDKSYFENSGGGLTLSGGDPVFQPDFSYQLLKLAQANGIHTCLETAGYCKPEVIIKLAEVCNLVLFDFKHYKDADHLKYTSVSNKIILSNLDELARMKQPIILRCPIIPGVNDIKEHFEAIVELSNKYQNITAVEVMPFHDWGFHKYALLGRPRPKISDGTISKEIAANWIEGLRGMGCTKIK